IVIQLTSQSSEINKSTSIWCEPLEAFLDNPNNSTFADLYVLPTLFKGIGKDCYYFIIERWGIKRTPDISSLTFCQKTDLHLSCLKIGKELGYIIGTTKHRMSI